MKFQLTSLVTLAILYGSVTATPIPTEEQIPSITDTGLNIIGHGLADAFLALAPNAAKNGAFNAANACQNTPYGFVCPQRRDEQSEEQIPSITDTGLNIIGHGLADAFLALAPSAAKWGAFDAAHACQNTPYGLVCPQQQQRRDEQSEEQIPSITDTGLNIIGHGLADAFLALAPNAAKNGAFNAANACQNTPYGLVCPQRRDEQSEEQIPSITDTGLNIIGHGLADAFLALAPNAAKTGAYSAAHACQNTPYGFVCPQRRDEQSEEQIPSITDTGLNIIGHGLADAFLALAPGAARNGAYNAANACQNTPYGLVCPQRRDEQSEEQIPSITDTGLNIVGHGLADAFLALAPGATRNGAYNAANACQIINGRVYCPS